MNSVVAVATLVTGLAYTALGLLVLGETLYLWQIRGRSWMGLALAGMALSCGPHHMIHGYHLWHGADGGLPLVASTIAALPASVAIVYLRIEALLGRRGDRFITGTPWWLALGPVVFLVTFGALIGWTVGDRDSIGRAAPATRHTGHTPGITALTLPETVFDPLSLQFLTNVYSAIAYAIVGGLFAGTQVRRRPVAGGWSMSGCAFSALFATCALTHFAFAFTASNHAFPPAIDVPASTLFLIATCAAYRESLGDWKRRPLVGSSTAPQRRSPWAVETA